MDNKPSIWKERCIWIAALAFVIMLAVITFWLGGKGSEIVSYVSFAAACSSILLAVTAIFYSFLEHGYSRQHIGQMDALIREASSIMKDASRTVSEKATVFAEKASAFEKVVGFLQAAAQPTTVSAPSEHEFKFNASLSPGITLYVFYAISRSYVLEKSTSLYDLMGKLYPEEPQKDPLEYNLSLGILLSLMPFLEKGSLEIRADHQKAIKLPIGFMDHISDEVEHRKRTLTGERKENFQRCIGIIDQDFAAQKYNSA